MENNWEALLYAALGLIVAKIIDYIVGSWKARRKYLEGLEQDQAEETADLKKELRLAEDKITTWKDKFYALQETYNTLKASSNGQQIEIHRLELALEMAKKT